jgi:hypothetical protein
MHHSETRTAFPVALIALALLAIHPLDGATLQGSRASLLNQQQVARQHDYTLLKNGTQVQKFVRAGLLVPIRGNQNYVLKDVSHPYGRPETKLFIERLAAEYHSACGERLVVTSITRPTSEQPKNASPFSVHPTGMALDLRIPAKASCRSFLEPRLLRLERENVLDATRENRPPHYHVALFPSAYRQLLARAEGKRQAPAPAGERTWQVSSGDTLWDIARRVGVSVTAIKTANGLQSTMIKPGQVLRLP